MRATYALHCAGWRTVAGMAVTHVGGLELHPVALLPGFVRRAGHGTFSVAMLLASTVVWSHHSVLLIFPLTAAALGVKLLVARRAPLFPDNSRLWMAWYAAQADGMLMLAGFFADEMRSPWRA